jgi:hypothetical protein
VTAASRTFAVAGAAACVLVHSAAGAGPTHAEFVQQAEIACMQAAEQTKSLAKPKTTAQAANELQISISIGESLRSTTLAIPAPAADRPLIHRGMAAIATELGRLRHARSALLAGNTAAYQADVRQAQSAHTKAVAAARKLGLTACT